MATNFFYYRCPCSSADCNGTICRYQDIVTAPVPSQYTAPSCTRFTPERKLVSYQTTPKDISNTITRDNFRWTPYSSQTRSTQENSTTPKTSPERCEFNSYLYDFYVNGYLTDRQCKMLFLLSFLCQRRKVTRLMKNRPLCSFTCKTKRETILRKGSMLQTTPRIFYQMLQ